jgi:drug/metabolite transporter (DMT)-like permease
MSKHTVAYLVLAGFCLLSSVRDVLSEVLFKHHVYESNPVFVLFVYSIVTQIVAGVMIFAARIPLAVRLSTFHGVRYELFSLNLFTLTAFLFYFLAINSPLGAAVNAFVDYGSSPVLTALVGAYFTGMRLNQEFAWAAVVCLLGLVILRVRTHNDSQEGRIVIHSLRQEAADDSRRLYPSGSGRLAGYVRVRVM